MSAPDRHQRLGRLFSEARRLDGEQRQAFLDRACPAKLREELEQLLDEDDRPTGPLDAAPGGGAEVLARALAEAGDAQPEPDTGRELPRRIGRYSIIRLIGEGGMGVVYEAEQQEPRRRVALKVVRPGLVAPSLMLRFRHEAQVLGHLEHPGIARIYEAGTSDTGEGGRPFFAMEFIAGRPLLEYARDRNLPVRERLVLVAHICDALHHAHQKGVIHRDLKPANVLVDEAGRPKVVDFGIARATDADIQSVTLHTGTGQLVGTLPYMSPEQAAGDPAAIDIRSDVYAVGVMMYELLTGRLPYGVRDRLVHEAGRVIREQEPSRLSAFDRTLRGDVETIVARALEKEPQRRYQSAAELAADIRRYLNDEPIIARPASTLYQLRKFARRHRALVGAAAVVMVVLTGATVVSTAFAFRAQEAASLAEQEQREAEAQAAIAEAVNEFLNEDLLAAVHPDRQGRDVTMLEALGAAAAGIEERFPDQPMVEAQIRSTIGNTYLALGRHDLAEPHLRRSLELHEQQLGARHEDTLTMLNRMGRLMHRLARLDEAEHYYARCLALRREVLGAEAELTFTTMANLAGLHRQQGRYEEAMALYREATAIADRTLEPDAAGRLSAMEGLAGAYKDLGRYDEAAPLYRRVLEGRRRTMPGKPGVPRAMNNLAVTYMRAGRLEEAHALLAEAVPQLVELLTERHPTTLAVMSNLARVKMRLGRPEEAEPMLLETLAIRR